MSTPEICLQKLACTIANLPETVDGEDCLYWMFSKIKTDSDQKGMEEFKRVIVRPTRQILNEQYYFGYILAQARLYHYINIKPALRIVAQYGGFLNIVKVGFRLGKHLTINPPHTIGQEACSELAIRDAYFARLSRICRSTTVVSSPIQAVCKFIEDNPVFSNTKTNAALIQEGLGAGVMSSLRSHERVCLYRYRWCCQDENDSFKLKVEEEGVVLQLRSSYRRSHTLISLSCKEKPLPGARRDWLCLMPGLFLYLQGPGGKISICCKTNDPKEAMKLNETNQFKIT